MKQVQSKRSRPDIDAAVRGGDWTLGMNGEGVPGHATLKQALHWEQIYTDILEMEEKVLTRIRQLMDKQSDEARREVELTNVPVVVAQAERFRQRLSHWEARVHELNGVMESVSRRSSMKDQVRGKAEEIKGKVTGDRGEETKGKARQAVGNLKRTVRDVKEDLR